MLEIVNIDKLIEQIKSAANILIAVGADHTLDELAAALSLSLSFEKLGKKVTVFSSKLPLVEDASLYGVSKIKNQFQTGNLVVSIPDALTSVDKVTHYLDGDTLNIVVHPVEGSARLTPEKVSIRAGEGIPDLIILINTPFSNILNNFATQEQIKYSKITKFIIGKADINHGDEIIITPAEIASFSETAVWVLVKLGAPLDGDCAANLFSGMKYSTNFTPPVASASTFEAAAICLQQKPTLLEISQEEPALRQQMINKIKPEESTKDFSTSSQNSLLKDRNLPSQNINVGQNESEQQEDGNLEDTKVQSDWIGPKIFKSSDKT